MKVLLTLSLFISFLTYSQVEHVKISKSENLYPNISGVYSGEISYVDLCKPLGIVCSSGYKIVKFTLQYSDGQNDKTESFLGNKIPESLCDRIARNNMNQMIFFTDITAVNDEGKIMILTSFNLIPTK
jgi:hypothetical protein